MTPQPDSPSVLSFEEARHVVQEQAGSIRLHTTEAAGATEAVDLLAAAGRVLADPVVADRDIPPFPRSTRDGYAVRSGDLSQLPATLEVIGEIRAGENLNSLPAHVDPGQAVSIMTGAPVPAETDAVVMVEYTSRLGSRIEITRDAATGDNVVARGAEARQGGLLVDRGVRLNDAAIALAASVGKSRLEVYKRPRIAVLTTGDEIVGVDATPGRTQIRNSNSYSLAAQIFAAGGVPVLLPIAPDESEKLGRLIELGLQSDLLILTGGVSMGRYDLVEQVLTELGAEFFFTGAKIQPGRPVVFGRLRSAEHKYFFGLPGNPVSTMVTFELFARPIVEALSGMSSRKLTFLHARSASEIRVKTGLRRFLPAILSGELENSQVHLVAWQGSGDIAATARANCYVVIPPDCEVVAAGEWVAVMVR
ncbi:MAG: gephyrin-like molybdotransferase Glp [Candidatus Sulfotelmatobacter sp.]|jgi:molybdopterin molybdotransferase